MSVTQAAPKRAWHHGGVFLQADLELSFERLSDTVHVPPPTMVGRVLHWLTLGQTGDPWERETFVPADMLRQLAAALQEAGITDLVSASCDDEIVYRDEHQRDYDLGPILQSIADKSASEDPDSPAVLELVAHAKDDVGTYLIQLTAERVHPLERAPIHIRIYAVLGVFDVERLDESGYRTRPGTVLERLEQRMLEVIRSPQGIDPLIGQLEEKLVAVCRRIEAPLRTRLRTYPAEAVVLCSAVRVRDRLDYAQAHASTDPDATPILRDYPGLRPATFHLRAWLGVLTALGAQIKKTLIVDEQGAPVLHIGEEPAKLGSTTAYVPDGSIAGPPGALDIVYFDGHQYARELRDDGRVGTTEELLAGPLAWKLIREREYGLKPLLRISEATLRYEASWTVGRISFTGGGNNFSMGGGSLSSE